MKKKPIQKAETKKPTISVIDYTQHSLEELRIKHIDDCERFKKTGSKSWIHVFGARKTPTLEKMGGLFDIHPIILDDIN
ncbi:MAG TPA: magnesium and cobalt transport protein CorA, partial [Patescibacteria group bacterium]|nr:magnesium and cobalt transport protein CorA [Patescibacteria group bacterium]